MIDCVHNFGFSSQHFQRISIGKVEVHLLDGNSFSSNHTFKDGRKGTVTDRNRIQLNRGKFNVRNIVSGDQLGDITDIIKQAIGIQPIGRVDEMVLLVCAAATREEATEQENEHNHDDDPHNHNNGDDDIVSDTTHFVMVTTTAI